MRKSLQTIGMAAVIVGLWVSPATSDDETGFQALFDGRSLDGWQGDPERWRVEGGRIVGEIPAGQTLDHNTWLVWTGGTLGDFELRVEFRLAGKPRANSGIQFRCQADSIRRVAGYQADLDMGATWLGRIYDEHGRALLVERGTRVHIDRDGNRHVESFALAERYAVLFREDAWNEYRIRACGEHVSIVINGTLFSELVDEQRDARDLAGQLAFQLHSGPQTRVEFRNIRLRSLAPGEHRVRFRAPVESSAEHAGRVPRGDDGRALNLGFEDGTLRDWTATGTAFEGQPVDQDQIATRWPGQTSRKEGKFFIGGFELAQDRPVGALISTAFQVTHPYASFLIGGGADRATRVELVRDAATPDVIHWSAGADREEMRRVVVDLRAHRGERIRIRLVDEHAGGWGHLNFDDFRFHETPPAAVTTSSAVGENPILSHLRLNPAKVDAAEPGAATVSRMYLPEGFVAEVIAAEPRLLQPMAFTFDARGRIWVVEGHSYPQRRPEGEGIDRILIFSDEDADGTFETRKVFFEGLNLVSGLEVGHGGVWVGAAPHLLFIPDRNHDDRPDAPPQALLDGFGYQDTHETLNSFLWGPDGWLYGNQGVFNVARIGKPGSADEDRVELRAGVWRYHPVRHEFEVFAHGGSNQWGLDFDELGQLFMTHCRSRWGLGPTTHVIQGGHYWNQTNLNHADFVSGAAPPDYPFLRNYLLASARYGHGEGGAGKPGSRAVYGGHSHVGTMIYLGNNWPDSYRNHLLTHNLHGHQINHQINRPVGSTYDTVHAGYDVFYCDDVQHIGVALKYGPDGAVYSSDWYDARLCHNPNVEQWDRTNGRMYRIAFAATYAPVAVNLAGMTDEELVEQLLHANDWFARTARRVLHERAAAGPISAAAARRLSALARTHADVPRRLHALWSLDVTGLLDERLALELLADSDEHIRGWTIQLACANRSPGRRIIGRMVELARTDPSPVVRRCLASAMSRVPGETAWEIAEALSQHAEDAEDRHVPQMIWFGLARYAARDPAKAMDFAERSKIPVLVHYVRWYLARQKGAALDRVIAELGEKKPASPRDILEEMNLALGGETRVAMPGRWSGVAGPLYASPDARVRSLAENLGALFGDQSVYVAKRRVMADPAATAGDRRHAFTILTRAADPDALPLFLSLLDDDMFRSGAIAALARFDSPDVAQALVARFTTLPETDRARALDALTSRVPWSLTLLDAVAEQRIGKDQLTEYYVRQLANLNSPAIDRRLAEEWGKVRPSTAERLEHIARLDKAFSEAPLWAYNINEGQKHFQKHCAACHRVNDQGIDIGPRLAGSGTKGARYFFENIIDPNAVIGSDYMTSVVLTDDGRVVSGLIVETSDSAITIQTATDRVIVPRSEIDSIKPTDQSLMPERLLDTLNDREIIELMKYLSSL